MLEIIMASITYVFFAIGCFYLLKPFINNLKIRVAVAMILALTAVNIHSLIYVLMLYVVSIGLLLYLINIFLIKQTARKSFIVIMVISLLISSFAVIYGVNNMNNIIKTKYDIYPSKELSKDYTITMIGDLHYPTTMDRKQLQSLVNRIKKENSDIIMLCGDIVDEYTTNQQVKEAFELLGQLTKTSKVYYVFGNHDTRRHSLNSEISKEKLATLISNEGIVPLQDQVVAFNDEIMICGRNDYSEGSRKEVKALLKNVNQDDLLIMLDHQPKQLEENANQGVDLHLSGHTHSGQLFPLYLVYELTGVNELNYGDKKINQMTAINTSGVAGWGVRVRNENHSEYVVIDIHH